VMVAKGLFYLCIYNSEKKCVVVCSIYIYIYIYILVVLHEDSVGVDAFSESSVAALSVIVQ
jgi:hypothetical protein